MTHDCRKCFIIGQVTGKPKIRDPQSRSGEWLHVELIQALTAWVSNAIARERGLIINVRGESRSGRSTILAVTACQLARSLPDAKVSAGRYLDSGKYTEWDLPKLNSSDALAAGKAITGLVSPAAALMGIPILPQVTSLVGQFAQTISDWRAASNKLSTAPKMVHDLRDRMARELSEYGSVFIVDDLDVGPSHAFAGMLLDQLDVFCGTGPTVLLYSSGTAVDLRPRIATAEFRRVPIPPASDHLVAAWLSPCSADLARSLSGSGLRRAGEVSALYAQMKQNNLLYIDESGREHAMAIRNFGNSIPLLNGLGPTQAQIENLSRATLHTFLAELKRIYPPDQYPDALRVFEAASIEGLSFTSGAVQRFTEVPTRQFRRLVRLALTEGIIKSRNRHNTGQVAASDVLEFENPWTYRALRRRARPDEHDLRRYADAILRVPGKRATSTLIALHNIASELNDDGLSSQASYMLSRSANPIDSDLDKLFLLESVKSRHLDPADIRNLSDADSLLEIIDERETSEIDFELAEKALDLSRRWERANETDTLTSRHAGYHALFRRHHGHYDLYAPAVKFLCEALSPVREIESGESPVLISAMSGLAQAEDELHHHDWATALALRSFRAAVRAQEPHHLALAAMDIAHYVSRHIEKSDLSTRALKISAAAGLRDASARIVAARALRMICEKNDSFDGMEGIELAKAAAFIASQSRNAEGLTEFIVNILAQWPRPIADARLFAALICQIGSVDAVFSQPQFLLDVLGFAEEVLGEGYAADLANNCRTGRDGGPRFGYQNVAMVVRRAFGLETNEIDSALVSALSGLARLPQSWQAYELSRRALELELVIVALIGDRFDSVSCPGGHESLDHVTSHRYRDH